MSWLTGKDSKIDSIPNEVINRLPRWNQIKQKTNIPLNMAKATSP